MVRLKTATNEEVSRQQKSILANDIDVYQKTY